MPSQYAGRLCVAAVVGSSLAAYTIRLILSSKTIGSRHAQLLVRLQQAMAKVPDLYKLAANHRLALTVPLWCASALKLIQTLTGRYSWMKGFVLRSLTVSVTVPTSDILSTSIQQWITQVEQPKRRYYKFTATAGGGIISNSMSGGVERVPKNDDGIRLRPIYKDVQFWDGWRPFWIVRHTLPRMEGDGHARTEDGPMTIMTLGYSTAPIMKFLETCQRLAEDATPSTRDAPVIRVYHPYADDPRDWARPPPGASVASWGPGERKVMRRLESVYIDETVKDKLVKRIRLYVHPLRSQMYSACSVPRRLGFLFHGPPARAKRRSRSPWPGRSGCRCPAGELLRAARGHRLRGLNAGVDDDDNGEPSKKKQTTEWKRRETAVTLSGLLNVLDGPDSVDGRILLMSSNHPEQLDPALVRPGRVDQKILLGHISQACAETMFLRIYTKFREALRQIHRVEREKEEKRMEGKEKEKGDVDSPPPPPPITEMTDEELRLHAADFGPRIPPGTFTPAELQVYIFDHEESPCAALEDLDDWVKEKIGNEQGG
ncbi:hypothetical protein PG993_013204 [Apiospora rasikravindrae]|uniref:Uncharacterized protein n=1 Tax=Apiospora rasikravindrae TaxID=990691 RepID=A0ABR1RX08_9PEZI